MRKFHPGSDSYSYRLDKAGKLVRVRDRPRHSKISVNAFDYPQPPGDWIDDQRCSVCGETYQGSSYGVDFSIGAARIRERNPGGGYKSRGSILHAMRAEKLERFYDDHAQRHRLEGDEIQTGEEYDQEQEDRAARAEAHDPDLYDVDGIPYDDAPDDDWIDDEGDEDEIPF